MFTCLTELNIEFVEQMPSRSGFVIDFAIFVDDERKCKIALEVDGEQWHQNKRKDNFKNYMLKKEGWIVIRFGEMFNTNDVKDKLQPYI